MLLISQGSTDFANVSGAGQVINQSEDKLIVISRDEGGAHQKTHSSASDYMEFEADQPIVGYSPSHAEAQKVVPKDKFEKLKERLAEHH